MMSDNNDEGSSGILCVVSRQAGTVAGTSIAISKRMAGYGVKTVATSKDWLKRPLKILMPARDKKSRTIPEASALESMDEQGTGRNKAAKTLIASLESKLAAAQRGLQKAQSNAEKTHSKLASKLGGLKAEKESVISDLEQARNQANEASVRQAELKTRVAALESDLTAAQRQLEMPHKKEEEDAQSQSPSDISRTQPEEETALSDRAEEKVESAMEPTDAISDEELNVKAAVFSNATDNIIFTRALSDIASQDATVRADAAETMACVRHEFSVKALVAQMACESSAQVRQECIKSLGTLDMKEALPTVERALADGAGSVRLAAVWGLYHLAGTKSAPALIRMFTDKNEEVRRRAATCIGWLGQEELAVELLPLLNDNSVSVRRAAVEAMGNLRSRQVVSSLIEQLNNPAESIRKVVFIALEKITGKKMSKSLPKDEEGFEHLIARWQEWWKEEILG
ncbi:MAG: HEAT repeat domain-containing protein [Planctomycetota bacterium]|jgi:HEAT repeat protein